MIKNIELIGNQSNKVDKSEAEVIKRIIEARSKSLSDKEMMHSRNEIKNSIPKTKYPQKNNL